MIDRLQTVGLATLIALAACGKKVDAPPPTVAPTAAPTTEPTKTEPTKAEPTKAEPTKAEPTKAEPTKAEPTKTEPTKAEPTKAEPATDGVVPAAVLEQLTEQDGGSDATPDVDKAKACAGTKKGAEDGCYPTDWYGVFAFHADGRVAIVSSKNAGGCGDSSPRFAFYGAPPELAPTAIVELPDNPEDEDGARLAYWSWLAKAVADGFTTTASELRTGHADIEAGILTHTPLIRLGGALDKHWLWAHSKAGDKDATITLVAPDNKASWDLGRVAHVDMKCKEPRTDADEPCEDATLPSLEQAILAPGGKALVVTANMAAAMHCGPRFVSHHVLPLPDGVATKAP